MSDSDLERIAEKTKEMLPVVDPFLALRLLSLVTRVGDDPVLARSLLQLSSAMADPLDFGKAIEVVSAVHGALDSYAARVTRHPSESP